MSEEKRDVEEAAEVSAKAELEGQAERKPKRARKKREALAEELEKLRAELEEKKAELEEKHDRLIRLAADFDNYKKRVAKERAELLEMANRELILKFLPVLDNLERAMDHRESSDFDSFYKGIEMILSQFRNILRDEGVEPIEAVGRPFDPELHEAVMQVDEGDCDSGTVVGEFEKGYTLKGKVIRHSKVSVRK